MTTVDFTLEDLRRVVREESTSVIHETVPDIVHTIVRDEIIAERAYTRPMIDSASAGIKADIVSVRKMLEEDARAESARLTKVDQRSDKTARLLMNHTTKMSAHGGAKAAT